MDSTNKASPTADRELPSLTEVFHRINSVIPDSQKLVTVEPDMAAANALDLLTEHG